MVRGRDLRASNIAKTVRLGINAFNKDHKGFGVAPAWLKAIERIPPSELLTRPLPVQHQSPNPKLRKVSKKLFKPQNIVYEEDALRKQFYQDHPWELARPRVILEIDGKDAQYCDWSKGIRQPGILLTGECVVQRQLWLMRNRTIVVDPENPDKEIQDPENPYRTIPDPENPPKHIYKGPLSRAEAYDQARKEFYALRHEEEVEKRIAREEAMMVGAYFGKSRLQVGDHLESQEFERWKGVATRKIGDRFSSDRPAPSYTPHGSKPESEEVSPDELLEELNKPPASSPLDV